MTEVKKIELTEEALDQIAGGLNVKKAVLIGVLAATGIGIAIGYRYEINKHKKEIDPKVASAQPLVDRSEDAKMPSLIEHSFGEDPLGTDSEDTESEENSSANTISFTKPSSTKSKLNQFAYSDYFRI